MAQEEMDVGVFQEMARTGTVSDFKNLLQAYGAIGATDENGRLVDKSLTGRGYLKQAIESKTEAVSQKAEKMEVLKRYDIVNGIEDTYEEEAPAADVVAAKAELEASTKTVLDAIESLKKEFQRVAGEQDSKIAALEEKVEARGKTIQAQGKAIDTLTAALKSTQELAKNAGVAVFGLQVKVDGTDDTVGLEDRIQAVEQSVGKVVRTRSPITTKADVPRP